ncbi:hypothetical protein DAPPUDRAFT_338617 [Daphnia pulex]|uniref:Uncharacterized protein n=1 Tax=Daphnia pulex TaxID=6669 RepID=E9I2Z5_DAPPU|nr:hypothetical protein DAPPUDRAFT_338617 [Daphnia pulex]|eukprot:EFX61634.1 hypothetical protein DAPPUDRAFT_338617 [Daphnia pulex]
MEDAPLNFKEIKALNTLKKEFGFELAVYKKEMAEAKEPISDRDLLHSLIIMDCNKSLNSVIQPQFEKYVNAGVLTYERFAALTVELLIAISMNTIQDLQEDPEQKEDYQNLSHELLFAYKALNPTITAVSFEEETIHEYCNSLTDQDDEEE